jgi:hypothetical protein
VIRSFVSGSLGSHQLKPALVGQCTRFLLSGDLSIIDESIDSATKDCNVSSETLCNTLECMKDQVLREKKKKKKKKKKKTQVHTNTKKNLIKISL